MKYSRPRHAASTSICDISRRHGDLQITLLGTTGPLNDAQKLVLEAAKAKDISIASTLEPVHPQEHDYRITHVTFTFPDATLAPDKALELVHLATGCDIGATIRGNYTTYDTRSRRGQTNTRFIPIADITVKHEDEFMQETVATYLRRRLDEIFTGISQTGEAGMIGLPSEYNYSGNLQAEARTHKTIELTFPERETLQGHKAKLNANAISEHLSGLLGISETLVPQRGKETQMKRF